MESVHRKRPLEKTLGTIVAQNTLSLDSTSVLADTSCVTRKGCDEKRLRQVYRPNKYC